MKKTVIFLSLIIMVVTGFAQSSFYDFKVKDIDGNDFDLAKLKGKKVLVVNTASKCGLTPQYKQLQSLYEQFGGEKFVIVGFPANNFMKQEPGTNEEIAEFCEKNYGVTFPMMEKIYAINPKSELLQVLAARAVNELERAYLPTYYQSDLSQPKVATTEKKQPEVEVEKPGFFARIWNFIVSLFSKSSPVETTQKADLSNPNRIPFYTLNSDNEFETSSKKDYLSDLSKFTEQVQSKDDSEFWKITDAYLQFLNKEYSKSNDLLNEINTNNPDYLAQIKKMKMLNDIVSRPVIDDDFEKHLYQDYKELFAEKPQKTTDESSEDYGMSYPSPEDFIRDVLANRYFLQGDFAKSFLMNNDLSDFRNDPNYDLAVKLNEFNKKQNKNSFETEVIAKNMNSVGNTDAYFNLVFGDFAMRNAEFEKAKDYYDKAKDFSGYTLDNEVYNYNTQQMEKVNTSTWYNGYKNISSLVFGHNKWVSFGSDANQTMIPEVFKSEFPFINFI